MAKTISFSNAAKRKVHFDWLCKHSVEELANLVLDISDEVKLFENSAKQEPIKVMFSDEDLKEFDK